MAKILLNDILALTSAEIQNTKLKFNIYNGNTDPLDLYKENPEEVNTTWFLWHNADKENRKANRYFSVGQLAICFLRIANDTWLLTTIKNISKVLPVDPEEGGVGYDAQEDKRFEKYFGRLVVKYHNTSMAMGKKYGSVMDELEVLELLNDQFTGDEFPGYENVRLTYRQLKTVIDRQLPGWIAALQNTKAVYLITDTSNGLLYVGSATAQDGMLLQRWSSYVANGHGGNVDLKRIVQEKGFTYVQDNFQYSIIENYNAQMDDNYILKRESWWKETLKSKVFGYNKN